MSKENKKAIEATFTGTVIFYLVSKGYGFIKVDETGQELFFHHTEKPASNKILKAGQKVSFSIGTSDRNKKGDVAKNITIIE